AERARTVTAPSARRSTLLALRAGSLAGGGPGRGRPARRRLGARAGLAAGRLGRRTCGRGRASPRGAPLRGARRPARAGSARFRSTRSRSTRTGPPAAPLLLLRAGAGSLSAAGRLRGARGGGVDALSGKPRRASSRRPLLLHALIHVLRRDAPPIDGPAQDGDVLDLHEDAIPERHLVAGAHADRAQLVVAHLVAIGP